MNEQAQQVLVDMLQRALSGVDAAVEFSQAQIPDVVEQLLMWHAIKSGLFFAIGFVSICAIPWLIKKTIEIGKWEKGDKWHGDFFGTAMASAFLWPAYLVWCAILVMGNLTWIQILIAPKLYLLEYAASLVK